MTAKKQGARPRRNENVSVYFVQAGDGGPIKIGVAVDVPKRLEALQTSNAARLTVLATMPCDHRQTATAWEQRLHAMFETERLRNTEWFEPHLDLLTLIDGIKKTPKGDFRLKFSIRRDIDGLRWEKRGTPERQQLYCSLCGCCYWSIERHPEHGRSAGEVCGDEGGQLSLDAPCSGVLELSLFTAEVRMRQLRNAGAVR